jgi:hypothetical protein
MGREKGDRAGGGRQRYRPFERLPGDQADLLCSLSTLPAI